MDVKEDEKTARNAIIALLIVSVVLVLAGLIVLIYKLTHKYCLEKAKGLIAKIFWNPVLKSIMTVYLGVCFNSYQGLYNNINYEAPEVAKKRLLAAE
jgi:predicted benzoate:H+ symporter BenE